ncbi:LegC family aminotransferase [Azospirillum soli]|uniref:LegC family aminotransferase n=1 Tax=Azospirillum soli TaxID=1304799 RepID=UPI001AE20327|nr:LegC family aminotransferase [Azospirillum soli]MBP2316263.1 perosamine synthetase [Azospirillum soli]
MARSLQPFDATAGTCVEAVLSALECVLRERLGHDGPIALHEPSFDGNEHSYVLDCLDSGWVSTAGPYVERFEREMERRCAGAHAIAVVNGTCALHVLLHALGVGPGDVVVCPAISFVATANAVAHAGAQPVFLDVEPQSLGLCPDALADFLEKDCRPEGNRLVHKETGARIAGVVAVHIFGSPAAMDRLAALCVRHGLDLIEDAAEALGSVHHGQPCGTLARAATFSFNGNKTVTSGGGGMVVTTDRELATRLKHLTTTARVSAGWEFDHDEVGFNYRLPNLNAALGLAQVEGLDERIRRKRHLHQLYAEALDGIAGVSLLHEPPGTRSNYWLNALLFEKLADRDAMLELGNARGFQCRPCWRLLPQLNMYRNAPMAARGVPEAVRLGPRIVNIPSSPQLLTAKALGEMP